MSDDYLHSPFNACQHRYDCRATARQVEALEAEKLELEQSFDLRWKADMRGIKRWQNATGRELVWPDHADLIVWLLERIEALEQPEE